MSHEPRPDERRLDLSKKPPTPRRRRSIRRAGAALASIAIHAAVLALFAGLMSRPRTTAATIVAARPALSVSLAPRRAERATSYAPPIRAAPPERPAASRPSPEPVRPETAPEPAHEPPEAQARATEATGSPPPADAPSDAAPDAASLPIAGAGFADGARGATGSGSGAAAREAAVMARIQAAKTYPDAARRRGIEGEVAVVFAIAADGSLLRVEAERAGAHPLLVRAADDAIAAAAPYPPGDGDETTYRVTIVYRLER